MYNYPKIILFNLIYQTYSLFHNSGYHFLRSSLYYYILIISSMINQNFSEFCDSRRLTILKTYQFNATLPPPHLCICTMMVLLNFTWAWKNSALAYLYHTHLLFVCILLVLMSESGPFVLSWYLSRLDKLLSRTTWVIVQDNICMN